MLVATKEKVLDSLRKVRSCYMRPIVVGLYGIDASGKSTLSEWLTAQMHCYGINATNISVDLFHNEAKYRYSGHKSDAEKYVSQSITFERIVKEIFLPLARDGRLFTEIEGVIPENGDSKISTSLIVESDSIIFIEGVFANYLPVSQYIDIHILIARSFNCCLKSAIRRSPKSYGVLAQQYAEKYFAGQVLNAIKRRSSPSFDFILDFTNDFLEKTGILNNWLEN